MLFLSNTQVNSVWTTENPIEITSLLPNTSYSYRMRSICNLAGSNDTTAWSAIMNFTTYRALASTPCAFTFETADTANWVTLGEATNKWVISGGDASAVEQGEKALYISKNGVDNLYDISDASKAWAYRPMYIAAGVYELNYMLKSVSRDSYDFLRAFIAPISLDLSTTTTTNKALIPADNGKMLSVNEWTEVTANVTIMEDAYYNLAFYWENNNNSGYQSPAAIDNITLSPIACMPILDVEIIDITDDAATLVMKNNNDATPEGYSYVISQSSVFKTSDYENAVTFTGDTIRIEGLNSLSDYNVSFRVNCSEEDKSVWSETFSFQTQCRIVSIDAANPFFDGFETYTDGEALDGCWSQLIHEGTKNWTIGESDSYSGYSHSGDQYAYLTYSTSADTRNKTSMMRQFYLSAENSYEIEFFTYLKNSFGGSTYVSAFVSGVDSDLDNMTQFHRQTVVPEADYQTYSAVFSVPEDGLYTIAIDGEQGNSSYYLIVDDLTIRELLCDKVVASIDSLSHDYARFSWTGRPDSVRLQISGQEVNIDTVIDGSESAFEVKNLVAASEYKLTTTGICGGEQGVKSVTNFITECATLSAPYSEDFESFAAMSLPICWNNDQGSLATVDYKWLVASVDGNKVMRFNSDYSKAGMTNTLMSPPIKVDAPIMLSFDFKNPNGGELSFFLSKDGGLTYSDTIKDAVVGITQWEKVYVPLNEYVGEEMTFVAYSTSNRGDGDAYHYLDNLRLVCHESRNISDTICAGSPYLFNGFNIAEEDLISGTVNTFSRLKPATAQDECDTTITLSLYVPMNYSTPIYKTICEGETFEFDDKQLTVGGSYTQTLVSKDRCDSLVVLHLTVLPSIYKIDRHICEGESYTFGNKNVTDAGVYRDTAVNTMGCDSITVLTLSVSPKYYEESQSICEGESYQWEGVVYTATGRYEKTYRNVRGCDSIRVLNLTVHLRNISRYDTICAGGEIFFADEFISDAGEYVDTLINHESGCEQITTMHLHVLDMDTVEYADIVCEDEVYTGHGFDDITISKDSVLYRVVAQDGCNVMIQLSLEFSPTVVTDTTVTINTGDTYNFCGTTYTVAGNYTCKDYTVNGCDSIINLTLIVSNGTGVGNVVENSAILTLYPNPVDAGQQVYLSMDNINIDDENLTVEIIALTGQTVYRASLNSVDGKDLYVLTPQNPGVYNVRIITEDGQSLMAKLIVK